MLEPLAPSGRFANLQTGSPEPAGIIEDIVSKDAVFGDKEKIFAELASFSCVSRSQAAAEMTLPIRVSSPGPNKIMSLPQEIREIVYKHVLKTGKPILPHLCDTVDEYGPPKFHDDNAWRHNSIASLLSITRVSKEIRNESLRAFYTKNSFAVGPDTVTYFAYLDSVGRFDLVRRLNLLIPCQNQRFAAWILRCVRHFDDMAATFERDSFERTEKELACGSTQNKLASVMPQSTKGIGERRTKKRGPLTAADLRRHPRYLVGGISDANLVILLRMLSTPSVPGSSFKIHIILPISNADIFEKDASLCWFSRTMNGLGVGLRLIVRSGSATLDDSRLILQWRRRFQGQDNCRRSSIPDVDIMRNAEMYPDLEKFQRPRRTFYYRRSCKYPHAITWFHTNTMGGGRL